MKNLCLLATILIVSPLSTWAWIASDGGRTATMLLARRKPDTNKPPSRPSDDGEMGQGPNWLERSFPVPQEKIDAKTVLDYNLGLSGESWETGPLSLRMYQAMTEKSSALKDAPLVMQNEILDALKVYAMDFTAKEATKAALDQNGLEMVLQEEEEDEGMWGDVDSIQLLDSNNSPVGPLYFSWHEAVSDWTPGQSFDFVVRQVPAKIKELSLEQLLKALDPDGKLREEGKAKNLNMVPDSDDFESLVDMAGENKRRVEDSPQSTDDVFAGFPEKRGYKPITAQSLRDFWESASEDSFLDSAVVMHVMDAFVSHGCLIVDLQSDDALKGMWKTVKEVFSSLERDFQPLQSATETGSSYAKVGYVSYESMEFLETRATRSGKVLPEQLSEEQGQSLSAALSSIVGVAKDVIRISTAASNIEARANGMNLPDDFDPLQAADQAVQELMDDGSRVTNEETTVSASPHRLCRYHNSHLDAPREIFGAHTDSTFLTIVPVSEVAGLEVYDEAAEQWYRPELSVQDEEDYSRYIVVMPGEFLQILSRQEIVATVHRVVVAEEGERFSAPILLRGRPGANVDIQRYFGKATTGLLEECDGKSMEEIHAAMQNSFQ